MKTRLLLLFAGICCFSESATAQIVSLYVGILRPATVTLPERIQKIYLVSRCEENYMHSQTEAGAQSSILKLKNILESTKRYAVQLTNVPDLTNAAETVTALNWREVGRITSWDTSALVIVLEKYEVLRNSDRQEQEHHLWRIYDFGTLAITDEFDHICNVPNNIPGTSPAVEQYAHRIMMHWEWVKRDYYKGGNKLMRAAWHCLDSSDWVGASAIWKQVAGDSLKDRKLAAKACYNVALYYELQNYIREAQEWIDRSKNLDNEIAAFYSRIIRLRGPEVIPLGQQLEKEQGQIPLAEFGNTIVHHGTSPSMKTEEHKDPHAERARKEKLFLLDNPPVAPSGPR